jgi:hypothetical protein
MPESLLLHGHLQGNSVFMVAWTLCSWSHGLCVHGRMGSIFAMCLRHTFRKQPGSVAHVRRNHSAPDASCANVCMLHVPKMAGRNAAGIYEERTE